MADQAGPGPSTPLRGRCREKAGFGHGWLGNGCQCREKAGFGHGRLKWPFGSVQGPVRRGAFKLYKKPPAGLNARLIV